MLSINTYHIASGGEMYCQHRYKYYLLQVNGSSFEQNTVSSEYQYEQYRAEEHEHDAMFRLLFELGKLRNRSKKNLA